MSEILKEAYSRPRALTQNRHHGMVDVGEWPKYIWEFYPIAQAYYHEFNPYFVHLIPKDTIFPEFKVFTVRDGVYAFTDFMVKNLKEIPKWKTLFLVPPSYAPLIPENVRQYFLSYTTTQAKAPDIRKAKVVTVFGLLCDQYFESYEKIMEKLTVLKDLPKDAKLEVCLSMRRNVLAIDEKENLHYIHVPEMIRKIVGDREIKWLRMKDLMDRSTLKDNVLIDLMEGQLMTCDSYLHFWYLTRGGTVMGLPVWKNENSMFDIDLSLNQKLHVHPLPDVPADFADIMFFSKTTKVELLTYPLFHAEVKKALSASAR